MSGDLIGGVRAPIFLVGPACSGDGLLLDVLGVGFRVSVARPHSASFLDSVPGVGANGERGHRLTAAEAPVLADAAHASLAATLVDEGDGPSPAAP